MGNEKQEHKRPEKSTFGNAVFGESKFTETPNEEDTEEARA